MQEGTRRPHETERKTLQKAGFENWFDRRQCSAGTEGQHSNESRRPVSHRLRYSDGGDGFQSETSHKRRMTAHAGTPSKHRSEPLTHNKINRKVSHPTKKGYTANRPPPKLKDTSETWNLNYSNFEVNLSDFPELCDATPSTYKFSSGQEPKTAWGPVKPAAIPDLPAAVIKEQSPNKVTRQTSSQQVTPIEKMEDSSTAFPGRENDPVSSNTYGSSATSWASIASQSPKVIPKISTPRESSPQVDTGQLQAGQKKKRKKKKKSKTAEQVMEEEEEAVNVPLQQVPPKIEDDEEFPNLFSSLGHPNRGPRQTLLSEMQVNTVISTKEASSLQSENKNTSNAAEGKIVSTTQKKGQQVSQKKSKALVQLDLGNMLTVLEQKQHSKKSKQDVKPIILSVGGALPVVYKEPTQKKHSQLQERIAHNPLDSTSPLVKKGKQREVPKAKKPSPLKRVILKEREERKQNRLLEEMDPDRLTCNASKVDLVSSATENSSEISSAQPCDEPTSEQSDAEMNDQNDSQSVIKVEINEENAPSKDINPNSSLNRPKIHSRKFRDYCSQMLSKDVDECVTTLLKELVRFQDRLYQKDPMKARMKRRLVMGLREVLKHLKLRKVKCVIISPNCERVQSKGGLDEALHTIIDTCREQCVPFVFALSRKSLGRCVNKAVPVTLVGIFNYDGAQDHYHKMIELSSQARTAYEVMVADLEGNFQEQAKDEGEMQQDTEPPPESTATEEPEYIKIWKRVLENDYNHKFLPFEEHFSSMAIGTDVDAALNYSGS